MQWRVETGLTPDQHSQAGENRPEDELWVRQCSNAGVRGLTVDLGDWSATHAMVNVSHNVDGLICAEWSGENAGGCFLFPTEPSDVVFIMMGGDLGHWAHSFSSSAEETEEELTLDSRRLLEP